MSSSESGSTRNLETPIPDDGIMTFKLDSTTGEVHKYVTFSFTRDKNKWGNEALCKCYYPIMHLLKYDTRVLSFDCKCSNITPYFLFNYNMALSQMLFPTLVCIHPLETKKSAHSCMDWSLIRGSTMIRSGISMN